MARATEISYEPKSLGALVLSPLPETTVPQTLQTHVLEFSTVEDVSYIHPVLPNYYQNIHQGYLGLFCKLQASQTCFKFPISRAKHHSTPNHNRAPLLFHTCFCRKAISAPNLAIALILFCFASEINEVQEKI